MHKYLAVMAWMLLTIFGLGSPPQQQVQPVAGVLTLNLVPGTSSFKVILSSNVTSVVIANPTPGTIISVIFTENATGGFTVAFGGNIVNPCVVSTGANAVTVCQFTFDSTANTWQGIGGGGTGGFGPNAILATNPKYTAAGLVFGAQRNWSCTWSSGSAIITCPSGTFTAADVGKVAFATSQGPGGFSAINGVLTCPRTTILSFQSSTQVTLNANCTATNSTPGSNPFVWGLDETAGWDAFSADVVAACGVGIVPAGFSLNRHGEFNNPNAINCTQPVGAHSTGPLLIGQGPAVSQMFIDPNFDFTTCAGGGGTVCFFGITGGSGVPGGFSVMNFGINGNGFGNPSLGVTRTFVAITSDAWALNFWMAGFGTVTGSLNGLAANGFPTTLFNVTVDGVGGGVECNLGGNSNLNYIGGNSECVDAGGTAATINGLNSYGTFFGSINSSAASVVQVTGKFTSNGDEWINGANVAYSNVEVDTGGEAILIGALMPGSNNSSHAFFLNTAGAIVRVRDSKINMSGTGANLFVQNANTTIFDEGGNTFTANAASVLSGAVFGQTNSVIGTACATGNFALTSGWGTSSVTSVAANGNIQGCHVTITGAAGAAGPVLTWTYPAAPFAAPGSCHLSGASGTLTGVSTGTPGATTVAYTFTGTPSAQTYVFDVGCP